jgi:hypothetical protein
MSSRQVVILIAILAAIAAALAWFLANYERTTDTVRTGFKAEALANPWLAAERLVRRMGTQSATLRALADLPALPPSGTLLLPSERYALTQATRQALLHWVSGGGYLIVEAEPAEQPDPLLDALGIGRFAVGKPGDRKSTQAPAEIRLPGSETVSLVKISRRLRLEAAAPEFEFDDGTGNALVLVGHEDGLVMVVNDLEFAANTGIGAHQHAQFLWQLVSLVPGDRAVHFFNVPARQSLWGWLKEHAWTALCGAAALLALWLWQATPRFGPIAPDPSRSRRRLLDHLRASGRYLWSIGGAQRMLDAARDACLRRIGRAHPDFLALSEAERPLRLAEILGWPEERARRLLAPPNASRMADFLQAIHLYQAVHEQLALIARTPSRKKQ